MRREPAQLRTRVIWWACAATVGLQVVARPRCLAGEPVKSTPKPAITKRLPMPGEVFAVQGRPAFLILPKTPAPETSDPKTPAPKTPASKAPAPKALAPPVNPSP